MDAALDLLFAAGESGRASIGVTATDPEGLQAQMELRIDVEEKPKTIISAPDAVIDDQVPDAVPPVEDSPIETDSPAEVEPAPSEDCHFVSSWRDDRIYCCSVVPTE